MSNFISRNSDNVIYKWIEFVLFALAKAGGYLLHAGAWEGNILFCAWSLTNIDI